MHKVFSDPVLIKAQMSGTGAGTTTVEDEATHLW